MRCEVAPSSPSGGGGLREGGVSGGWRRGVPGAGGVGVQSNVNEKGKQMGRHCACFQVALVNTQTERDLEVTQDKCGPFHRIQWHRGERVTGCAILLA